MNELEQAFETLKKAKALSDGAVELVDKMGGIVEEELERAMTVATAQAGARIRARIDRLVKETMEKVEG